MTLEAVPANLAEIQNLRALFLQESNCQIRYDACHARAWSDSYFRSYASRKRSFVRDWGMNPSSNTRMNRQAAMSWKLGQTWSLQADSCCITTSRSRICTWKFVLTGDVEVSAAFSFRN